MNIIVCEAAPHWKPELERELLRESPEGIPVRIAACTRPADIARHRSPGRPAVVVLDLHVGPEACLQYVGRRWTGGPEEPVIVIAAPQFRTLELPFRELGVIEYFGTPPATRHVWQVCRRVAAFWEDHRRAPQSAGIAP